MELFSGLARGSYLGCIAWTTLIVSNSVATVGQVFIIQFVTVIVAGPIVGVMVDRQKRRNLIIFAQFTIAASMMGLGGIIFYTHEFLILWLFGAVVIVTASRLMYRGAFDSMIKAVVEDAYVTPTVARAFSIHLVSTAAGMVATGVIIDRFSAGHGFMASACASVLLLVVAGFLSDGLVKTNARGIVSYWSDFKDGLEIFKSNKQIQMLALLVVVALPIGQLSNAVLSSFIRDDLGEGSDIYGFVDAAYAVGGMLAAALLSGKIQKFKNQYGEYFLAILAGASTIALSYSTEVLSLAFTHGLMGFFVWSCRIIINGKVIELCTKETVGRTKVYNEVLFSVSAMAMCLSPTVIKLEATASYFLFWGTFMIVAAVLLWCWKIVQSSRDQEDFAAR